MKVLITGASGLVGGNCRSYFAKEGWMVLGTHFSFPTQDTVYFNTLNISDPRNCDVLVFNAEVIVHCGALVNCDYCETHKNESYDHSVNVTMNLIQLAKQTKAYFVFISSDYIFDGQDGPYRENDVPNPLNVYGYHKLEAEKLIQAEITDSLIVRITNVYGEEIRGKNFIARIARLCQQYEQQGMETLKVPYDQFATPIDAFDVARALFLLISDKKTGIYHLASTDYLSRFELARRVLSYFPESKLIIEPVVTTNTNQVARRPLQGGLLKTKFNMEYPAFQFTSLDQRLIYLLQESNRLSKS